VNLYIACGLTHVPRAQFEQYVHYIHTLAAALSATGLSVNYALRDSDPQLAEKPFEERARLCYLRDRAMVEQADVMVADATFPSTGLGIELQTAEARDLPIILAFRRSPETRVPQVEYTNPDATHHALQIGEGYVSLMVLGMPSIFKVIGYTEPDTGIAQIVEAVGLLVNQPARCPTTDRDQPNLRIGRDS
jgi:hypothetical protein